MATPVDTDHYISTFPQETQVLLQQVRGTIKKTAPDAIEVISYGMPAFKLSGKMLAWFAGYERHIGFYPGSSGIAAFQKEIVGYKNAKGSVQFPLDKPMPVELIINIVKFKMAENLQKAEMKKKPRGGSIFFG
jgi:uncharacterized protein YdhG (YjbR/CyaY superfamily)